MIFSKTWQLVLEGKKTQTRRLVREGDKLNVSLKSRWVEDGNGRVRWGTFITYAVQPGRGKKAVTRIRITNIKRERLQDVSREDAIAEGMFKENHLIALKPATRFMHIWNSIHKKPGTRWQDNPEVWVLTFELVEEGGKDVQV